MRYLIAGDGDQREALERQADQLGVRDRVAFLGAIAEPELPGLYAAADIFVMPNRVDGVDFAGGYRPSQDHERVGGDFYDVHAAAEESGDKALASSVYSKMGGGADKARADALEGVIKVQAARREHGLPPCK